MKKYNLVPAAGTCFDDAKLLDIADGSWPDMTEVDNHVDTCISCRELLALAVSGSSMPKNVGRYTPYRLVGQGGFGVVYAAEDPLLAREVAIKIIDKRMIDAARCLAEAQDLAKVKNPHVLSVFDVIESDTHVAIVTELLQDAVPIDAWARNKPRDVIAQAMRDVCQGIAAIHQVGLRHGDIKPANIVLEGSRVVVIDLGLASRGGGTPRYMSPKKLQSGSDPGEDVYALGQVLQELTSGCEMFSGAEGPSHLMELKRKEVASDLVAAAAMRGEYSNVQKLAQALEPPKKSRRQLALLLLFVGIVAVITAIFTRESSSIGWGCMDNVSRAYEHHQSARVLKTASALCVRGGITKPQQQCLENPALDPATCQYSDDSSQSANAGLVAIKQARLATAAGNLKEARGWLAKSEGIQRAHVVTPAKLQVENLLLDGELNAHEGNLEVAIERLKKANSLDGTRSDILTALANAYRLSGSLDKSLSLHKRALALDEEAGREKSLARHFHNIGGVFRMKLHFTDALAFYRRSLALKEAPLDRALTMNSIGITQLAMDDWRLSVATLAKGRRIVRGTGHEVEALINYNFALASKQGRKVVACREAALVATSLFTALRGRASDQAVQARELAQQCRRERLNREYPPKLKTSVPGGNTLYEHQKPLTSPRNPPNPTVAPKRTPPPAGSTQYFHDGA